MSFQRKRYRLTWADGTEYAGLQVTCRPPKMGELLDMQSLLEGLGEPGEAGQAAMRNLAELFSALISEWNVTGDDGQPEPVTAESLLEDGLMFTAIMAEYQAKINFAAQVPLPLRGRSGSTPASQASPPPGIPVDPLPDPETTTEKEDQES